MKPHDALHERQREVWVSCHEFAEAATAERPDNGILIDTQAGCARNIEDECDFSNDRSRTEHSNAYWRADIPFEHSAHLSFFDKIKIVRGVAMRGPTLNAAFASGSYVAKQYDILQSAELGGTTFNTVATSNPPAGFASRLSFTATDVFLNLTAALGAQQALPGNQQNVANAINSFFNNGGDTLPPGFVTLFGLAGNNFSNALSQVSGEAVTGAQQTGVPADERVLWADARSLCRWRRCRYRPLLA